MRHFPKCCAAVASGVLMLGVHAAPATAQVEITAKAAQIKLTGRAQIQFNQSSADAAPVSSTFFVRRLRLTAEVTVNDFVSGRLQPEYGEGIVGLRDAFVALNFHPSFRATAGQFKRPFDAFELVSSTQILVIERSGGVLGVDTCGAIGGLCSFSRFTEKLLYSDRDIGFMVDGALGGGMRYYVSLTNGRGPNNRVDENTTKSYTGRLEYSVSGLRIGAHVGVHDYPNDSTSSDEYATAFGGDVDWGRYEQPGLHVKAGVVYGDNWKNLAPVDPTKFFSTQGIVTYLIPVRENRFVYGIQPVARLSWGDPDADMSDDDGLLLTPGLVVYFTGRNKIAANVDIWSPATGVTEWSSKVQLYFHF